jgi:hypothetical protein
MFIYEVYCFRTALENQHLHDFRYVAIGEHLRGGIISPIQTMIENNHSSLTETMGYGYSSPKDEAAHAFEATVLPEHKYHTLENQPLIRLIPGGKDQC